MANSFCEYSETIYQYKIINAEKSDKVYQFKFPLDDYDIDEIRLKITFNDPYISLLMKKYFERKDKLPISSYIKSLLFCDPNDKNASTLITGDFLDAYNQILIFDGSHIKIPFSFISFKKEMPKEITVQHDLQTYFIDILQKSNIKLISQLPPEIIQKILSYISLEDNLQIMYKKVTHLNYHGKIIPNYTKQKKIEWMSYEINFENVADIRFNIFNSTNSQNMYFNKIIIVCESDSSNEKINEISIFKHYMQGERFEKDNCIFQLSRELAGVYNRPFERVTNHYFLEIEKEMRIYCKNAKTHSYPKITELYLDMDLKFSKKSTGLIKVFLYKDK